MTIDSASDVVVLLANKTLAHNYRCTENSILAEERKTFANEEQLNNTITLISILFDACIQHLSGYFINLDNIYPLAAYSCFRSYLETSALCAWLSDPKINAKERLARQLTYQIHGQKYFIKPFEKEADSELLKKQKVEKIKDLVKEGNNFGLKEVLDKNGFIIGILEPMPNISNLIESCFDLKPMYSFLSNVVHGHHTEMITSGGRIGKKVVVDGMERVPISREVKQELVENLEVCLKNSYGLVLDSIWELFGWEATELNFVELINKNDP